MTLEDLPTQPPSALDALPVEVLARLQGQAQTRLAGASQMVAILHGVLRDLLLTRRARNASAFAAP